MSTVSSNTRITPEPSVASRPRAFERERHIQFVGPDEHPGRAAEQNCLQCPPATHPARPFQHGS